MSPIPQDRMSRCFDGLEQQRCGYHDTRFQHNCRKEPDQRRFSYASQTSSNHTNNDTTSISLNALEIFSAKISVQLLAQTVFGSIQEFDGKDKVTTVPRLDQFELVTERSG